MPMIHDTLAYMLSLKRPSGGYGEAQTAAWLAKRLDVDYIDAAGNLHVDMRYKKCETLFTSHLDSVHRSEGYNMMECDGKWLRAKGDVLGADDAAGVAVMAYMIEQKVPGYYIFFRQEECGGIGSKWLADNMPDLLREFKRAVAFDRAGYNEVITHQAGERCCSDEFALALSKQLTNDDMTLAYAPSDGGVYTDTAEFTYLIPECTNLSIGYFAQHSNKECLDVDFLELLADQLVRVKWEDLPTELDAARVSRYGESASLVELGLSDNEAWSDEDEGFLQLLLETVDTTNKFKLEEFMAHKFDSLTGMRRDIRLRDESVEDMLDMLYRGMAIEDIVTEIYECYIN